MDAELYEVQKELEICRKEARRVALVGVEKRCSWAIEVLAEVRKALREKTGKA